MALVVDQAGRRAAGGPEAPQGLHLAPPPACCPGLQPAERPRPPCDEGLADKPSGTTAGLGRAVADRLVRIKDEAARRLTGYHWRPRTPQNNTAFSRS